jgi:uncharacterized protein (TIGR03437 family)
VITSAILLAAVVAAFGQTRRLAEYALVLEDPPVAEKVHGRAELQSEAARAHLGKIRAAQSGVLSELARRKVHVTSSGAILVNAVFVRATAADAAGLAAIPGVKRVQYLPPVKRALTTAAGLVGVPAAWAAVGGAGNAGAGIKIGIIDSGIDQGHVCFQDSSVRPPAGFPKGDSGYTNNKVIVARSYVDRLTDSDPAYSTPDDLSPRDRMGHGTAIAMIAAGVQHAASLGTIAGVAPKAFLGNYKIFGSPGVADYTLFAAINDALTDAVADGMDIVTLSLQEGDPAIFGPLDKGQAVCGDPVCDVRAQAVENASAMGLLVVAAAGNGGIYGAKYPSLNSMDTPGTAPSAVTVGATQNAHLLYQTVRVNGLGRVNALFGDVKVNTPLTAPLAVVPAVGNDSLGCSVLPSGSLAGAVALVQRGTCLFSDKINHAQAAGAVAVIIYQVDGSEDVYSSLFVQNTGIPAVLIGNTDGKALKNYLGSSVTLDPSFNAVNNPNTSAIAPYSSRGPSLGNFAANRDYALKPEVVAPGSDIYTATQSYDPNGDAYNFQGHTTVTGTSYAVGFVAGAAAVAKGKNANLNTPARLKSAVVNTATADIAGGAHVTDAGAGKLNVADAVAVAATLDPAAISFGPVGAGTLPVTRNLTITNVSGAQATFAIAVRQLTSDSNARVTVSGASVVLASGASQTISVVLQGSRPNPGAYEGFLDLTGAGPALHLPYYYVVGDGAAYNIQAIKNGSFTGVPNDTGWRLGFRVVDQYGVPVPNLPVNFTIQQGGGKFNSAGGDKQTDVLGNAGVFVDLGPQQGDQIFSGTAGGLQQVFYGFARNFPVILSGGVVNAATFKAGNGLAPGSYISIFGNQLADANAAASTTYLPVSLASAAVSFDGGGKSVPGHLHFVSPGQINVQIPWEFAGQASVQMKVTLYNYLYSDVYTVPLAQYSPGSFGILDQNYAAVTASNAARRGQVIQIFANGLGPVDGHPPSGEPTAQVLPCNSNPTVTIGGVSATVQFCGLVPPFVGLYQLNVTVPSNAPAGAQTMVISNGGASANVSLPVQ